MFLPNSTSLRCARQRKSNRRPRGMAVLLVLGLLAVTLAVSYATLRTQSTTVHTARNVGRSLDARLAAESGLAAAMRQISDSDWEGVDVPLSGNVTDDSWYEVSFETGDSALASSDPDYAEFPYRLTITSTGYAADPADPDIRSIHRVRSIVQLARKRLSADPANWSSITSFTLHQWANQNAIVQVPVRASGAVKIEGPLQLCPEYPQPSSALKRYLSDLNLMRQNGLGDYRPFQSPLTLVSSRQSGGTLALLQNDLGLTTVNSAASAGAPLTHPGSVSSYRLYPGGKSYTPPIVQDTHGSTLQNVTLAADPVTNPLGLFRSQGTLSLQNNVRLTGMLVLQNSSDDLFIYGTNVVLQAADLPKLESSNQRYQLPVALVADDLRVESLSSSQISGLEVILDEL